MTHVCFLLIYIGRNDLAMPSKYIDQYVDQALPNANISNANNGSSTTLADIFIYLLVNKDSTPWNEGTDLRSQSLMVSIKGEQRALEDALHLHLLVFFLCLLVLSRVVTWIALWMQARVIPLQ